jgi:hypothetical protein
MSGRGIGHDIIAYFALVLVLATILILVYDVVMGVLEHWLSPRRDHEDILIQQMYLDKPDIHLHRGDREYGATSEAREHRQRLT